MKILWSHSSKETVGIGGREVMKLGMSVKKVNGAAHSDCTFLYFIDAIMNFP